MTTNQKIDALAKNLDKQFAVIDKRFEMIDKCFAEQDEKFAAFFDAFMKQQEEIMTINQKLDMVIELTKKIPDIERSTIDLQENVTKVNFTLIAMQRKDDMILNRLSKLELA